MRDDESDQTVCMHMTISANRTPPVRTGVTVAQGSQQTSQVRRDEGINTADRLGSEMACLDLIHLLGDGDHELRWTGQLDEASFELTLKGKHDASDWDEMFPGYYPAGKKDGHQYSHYEQVITAEGWVQFKGGEKRLFNGDIPGARDRRCVPKGRPRVPVTHRTRVPRRLPVRGPPGPPHRGHRRPVA